MFPIEPTPGIALRPSSRRHPLREGLALVRKQLHGTTLEIATRAMISSHAPSQRLVNFTALCSGPESPSSWMPGVMRSRLCTRNRRLQGPSRPARPVAQVHALRFKTVHGGQRTRPITQPVLSCLAGPGVRRPISAVSASRPLIGGGQLVVRADGPRAGALAALRPGTPDRRPAAA